MGATSETITLQGTEFKLLPPGKKPPAIDRVKSYMSTWSEYKTRYYRSFGSNPELKSFGTPLDSKIRGEWIAVEAHMNGLLEDYFKNISGAALEQVFSDTVTSVLEPEQLEPTQLHEPKVGMGV